MSVKTLTWGLAMLAAVSVSAQEGPPRKGPGEPQTLRGRPALRQPASQEELEQATAFVREHSPNRYRHLQSIPEGSPARSTAMMLVVARWRGLQALKAGDASLYEAKLKQLHVEDDIYGILAGAQTPEERQALRAKVEEKVQELVSIGLAERERRIASLQRQLNEEQEKLAKDQKQVAAMVQRRTEALITEGPTALRPGAGEGAGMGAGAGRGPGIGRPGRPGATTQPRK